MSDPNPFKYARQLASHVPDREKKTQAAGRDLTIG
jgi:hypothetical protein